MKKQQNTISLSELINFEKLGNGEKADQIPPLGILDIDAVTNCIKRIPNINTAYETPKSHENIYTRENDLLLPSIGNGNSFKFAIVDKLNAGRLLLPGIHRIGNIKDVNNVPLIWKSLQDDEVRKQVNNLYQQSLPSLDSFKVLLDKININKYQISNSRISQFDKFVYDWAIIITCGTIDKPHVEKLRQTTNTVLSRQDIDYFKIQRKFNLYQYTTHPHGLDALLITNNNGDSDENLFFQRYVELARSYTLHINQLNYIYFDISEMKDNSLFNKLIDAYICIIPIKLFENNYKNIKIVYDILQVVNTRHLFINAGPETQLIIDSSPPQLLLNYFGDTVSKINYCQVGNKHELFSRNISYFSKAPINHTALFARLLFDLTHLTRNHFKYKVDENGSKSRLSNSEFNLFERLKFYFLIKGYEYLQKIPAEEFSYINLPSSHDILIYKLKVLEEEIISNTKDQKEAWQIFMSRCGGVMKGNNFARTMKLNAKFIKLFKDQLPTLYAYITKNGY